MKKICLDGAWRVRKAGGGKRIAARVPGCIHLDLLAARLIPDPFYRDNEKRVQWIGEADWEYDRDFEIPADFLEADCVELVCHGLDTLATITINGRELARTDNMFRTWRLEAGHLLKPGRNSIRVRFHSVFPYMAEKKALYRDIPQWIGVKGRAWVRKEQCNFGWDWGPTLVTCGIWRSIELEAHRVARLADVRIAQRHGRDAVRLQVEAQVRRYGRTPLCLTVSVRHGAQVSAEKRTPVRGSAASLSLTIRNPRLWWPNGLGDQPLYEVTARLCTEAGEVVDEQTRRLGLRTLRMDRRKDKWGESFRFVVNGVAFFAKGANWIPADVFAPRVSPADYRRLLSDAAAAHMNMLRVWGGGIYESDAFYDICDELGICVWQDFMFACAAYPTFDRAFMASVKTEAEDNVRRLRHHSCLALWCGNNELEQGLVGDEWTQRTMSWKDYSALFDKLLADAVRRLDPERAYWPGSPHSPVGDRRDYNNPSCGDAHLWDVWHGRQPVEWYRKCFHRFCSEFGFQSFPGPRTARKYTLASDRNVSSPVMEHHQRCGIGNSVIIQYMLDWFRMPKDFEMTLWLSQIMQAEAIRCGVEHWRRNVPRCMGALYWQLDDCWPVASWASIDYPGRWKALHYAARRFFAPVLISGVEDAARGRLSIHVANDLRAPLNAEARWTITTVSGSAIARGSRKVRMPAMAGATVKELDVAPALERHAPQDVLAWLELRTNGRVLSTNLVLFARPKSMSLAKPDFAIVVREAGAAELTGLFGPPWAAKFAARAGFVVQLKARRPALWTWLDLKACDAAFSDNFFHARPGATMRVAVAPREALTAADLRKQLVIRSLADTH